MIDCLYGRFETKLASMNIDTCCRRDAEPRKNRIVERDDRNIFRYFKVKFITDLGNSERIDVIDDEQSARMVLVRKHFFNGLTEIRTADFVIHTIGWIKVKVIFEHGHLISLTASGRKGKTRIGPDIAYAGMPAVNEILAGIESGSKVVVVDADDFAVVLQRRAEQNEVEPFIIKKIGPWLSIPG